MSHNLDPRSRIHGCLLGGAIGDALGYQVEFSSWANIVRQFGDGGVTEMRSNHISDDTQLTLFTADGLIGSRPGKEFASVRASYLDWLATQKLLMPPVKSSGLAAEEWLYERRAPGHACLSGLEEGGRPGVNSESKGCGTVMRSAPFGLLLSDPEAAFELSAQCSTITHGHPTAGESAGSLAMIIAYLMNGSTIQHAVNETLLYLQRTLATSETAAALTTAYELAGHTPPGPNTCVRLGEGWVAEEALAIAVYCALGSPNADHALTAAVSHGGDSDSTGAICGNILGAAGGTGIFHTAWHHVEGHATIARLSDELTLERQSRNS